MIEIKKFKVTFDKKPEYNAIWELELGKSGAFDYGNGTCVEIRCNGKHHDLIDTRYDKTVTKDFGAWCDAYMAKQFNPDFGPHIEKLDMIKFDPADLEGMRQIMRDHGDSDTMFPGTNENGERVEISVYHNHIVIRTMQDNDWCRINTYWEDGTREETYEK